MKKGLKTFLIAGVFSMMTASIFAQAPDFDLEKGTVKLNSGHEMPILGIGTYQLSNTQAENSVYWALKAGMRLIDTARIYGNEDGVGRGISRAIKEGICKREEIFVTTKMWTSNFSNGDAAVDASLKRLGPPLCVKIDVLNGVRNLSGGHSLCIHRNDFLVDVINVFLTFSYNL